MGKPLVVSGNINTSLKFGRMCQLRAWLKILFISFLPLMTALNAEAGMSEADIRMHVKRALINPTQKNEWLLANQEVLVQSFSFLSNLPNINTEAVVDAINELIKHLMGWVARNQAALSVQALTNYLNECRWVLLQAAAREQKKTTKQKSGASASDKAQPQQNGDGLFVVPPELNEFLEKMRAREKELKDKEEELQKKLREAEEAKQQLDRTQGQLDKLAADKDKLDQEKKELERKLNSETEEGKRKAEKALREHQRKLDELNRQQGNLERQLEEQKQNNAAAEKEKQKAQEEKEAIEAEKQQQAKEYEERIRQLEEEKERAEKEARETSEELEEAKAQKKVAEKMAADRDQLEDQVMLLQAKYESLSEQHQREKKNQQKLQKEKERVERERDRLRREKEQKEARQRNRGISQVSGSNRFSLLDGHEQEVETPGASPSSAKGKRKKSKSPSAELVDPVRLDVAANQVVRRCAGGNQPGGPGPQNPPPSQPPSTGDMIKSIGKGGLKAAGPVAGAGGAVQGGGQAVVRGQIQKGPLFAIAVASFAIVAGIVWYAWGDSDIDEGEDKPDEPEPLADKNKPESNTSDPGTVSNSTESEVDADHTSTIAHESAQKEDVESESATETAPATSASCEVITDDEWQVACLKLSDPLEQLFWQQLWRVQHKLMVMRYQPYTLNVAGKLTKKDLPADRQAVRAGPNWLFFPEELIELAQLTIKERSRFFQGLLRIPGLLDVSLSERVQMINAYGKFCGLMPKGYSKSCLQRFEAQIERLGLAGISKEFTPVPGHSLDYLQKLSMPGVMDLVPVWHINDDLSLSEHTVNVPVSGSGKHLHLLYSLSATNCGRWLLKESGEYTYRGFDLLSQGHWGWQQGDTVISQFAGREVDFHTPFDRVLVFDSPEKPFAFVCASEHGQPLELAWPMDYRQAGSIQKLLLALASADNTIPQELRQWQSDCVSRRSSCSVQRYRLHRGAVDISGEKGVAAGQTDRIYYRPEPKAIAFSKLNVEYQSIWLSLLTHAYESVGLTAEQVTLVELAESARLYCGVYLGSVNRPPLFACMHQLAESYLSKGWRQSKMAQWFVESFPDGRASQEPQLAVSLIRYYYGAYSLSPPVFLPALQQSGERVLGSNEARTVNRAISLPPGNYKAFRLMGDMSLNMEGNLSLMQGTGGFSFLAGSMILVNDHDPQDQHFIFHHSNPYLAEPQPAYHTTDRLYRPEDVYPVAIYGLKKSSKLEHDHGVAVFESKGLSCHGMKSALQRGVCKILTGYGRLDVLNTFYVMMEKYGNQLSLPRFQMVDPRYPNTWVSDFMNDESDIHRVLRQLHDERRIKNNRPVRLLPAEIVDIGAVGAERVALLVTMYDEAMKKAGIVHGKDWVMYLLMTHCGLLGQPLRGQCSDHVIEQLMKLKPGEDFPGLNAYRYSIGSGASERMNARSRDHVDNHSAMLVNWYIDKKLQFSGPPRYRFNFISSDRAAREVEPSMTESHEFKQDVVFFGLEPGKAYTLWRFDGKSGQWTQRGLDVKSFKVPPGQTGLGVNPFPVMGIFGIAEEGKTEPDSFFHFALYNNVAPGEKNHAEIREMLMDKVMPLTLWPQKIYALPAHMVSGLQEVYQQLHGKLVMKVKSL